MNAQRSVQKLTTSKTKNKLGEQIAFTGKHRHNIVLNGIQTAWYRWRVHQFEGLYFHQVSISSHT